ncbi:hypothetical protein BOSP111201_21375 [Bordetella sputigena]
MPLTEVRELSRCLRTNTAAQDTVGIEGGIGRKRANMYETDTPDQALATRAARLAPLLLSHVPLAARR